MTETKSTEFYNSNDHAFWNFLKKNLFFEQEMTIYQNSPVSELENHVRRIVSALEVRWDHKPEAVKPFYRNCHFIWVYTTSGEEPYQRITSVALVRFPKFKDSIGDLVYLDTNDYTDYEGILALREEALKVAGTWYEGNLTPYKNTAKWLPYMLNVPLLELIDESVFVD